MSTDKPAKKPRAKKISTKTSSVSPIDPSLDWKSRHDPRSLNYPIRGLLLFKPRRRDKTWNTGPILDQGREGACVGFGWTAETLAAPYSLDLRKVPNMPTDPNQFALSIYNQAKKIDDIPGEDYSGTSVLAGAQSLASLGIIAGYGWAFSIDEVIDALMKKGPVVLGINWYDGMYNAPNGVLSVTGSLVGGHCILAIGYRVSSPKFGGRQTILLQNSWGPAWGVAGVAEIAVDDLARLLGEKGEACLPLKHAYRAPLVARMIARLTSHSRG
jgi:hypothetical protein